MIKILYALLEFKPACRSVISHHTDNIQNRLSFLLPQTEINIPPDTPFATLHTNFPVHGLYIADHSFNSKNEP
jgi:hypothetical protein